MITLTLLHANHLDVPVQSWTFERESVVRIGRATDNHVVLYSAVVSRHHAELRLTPQASWEVISLGTNGTYVDGKRVAEAPIADGQIIRLARSGPNIRIHVGSSALKNAVSLDGDITLGQRTGKSGEPGRTRDNPDPPPQGNTTPATFTTSPSSVELDNAPTPDKNEGEHEVTVPGDSDSAPLVPDNSSDGETENPPQPGELPPPDPAAPDPKSTSPQAVDEQNRYRLNAVTTAVQRFDVKTGEPLNVREVIGAYKVLEVLGQGGMGITYLAWRNGQSIVLKTLNPEWVNHPKALELFNREAQVLQTLQHPGIPRLLDFFSIGNQPYLAMEIVYGENLYQRIARVGPVSQRQAVSWILEVCDVLTYLHRHDPPILHRDIKPENLICRSMPRDGRSIALVDFGAVKYLALEAGTHIGSAGYTAPEQQGGYASPLSDLYSLGPTLIYLLTGQDPDRYYKPDRRSSTKELRFAVESIPIMTPEMRLVVETLTKQNPDFRYQSAAEVIQALTPLHDFD